MDIYVLAEFVLSMMGFVGIINKLPLMLKEENDVPLRTSMAQSVSFVFTIICYIVLDLYMPAVVSAGIMVQWAVIGFRSANFKHLLADFSYFPSNTGAGSRTA